jgi:hypothetical protein
VITLQQYAMADFIVGGGTSREIGVKQHNKAELFSLGLRYSVGWAELAYSLTAWFRIRSLRQPLDG